MSDKLFQHEDRRDMEQCSKRSKVLFLLAKARKAPVTRLRETDGWLCFELKPK